MRFEKGKLMLGYIVINWMRERERERERDREREMVYFNRRSRECNNNQKTPIYYKHEDNRGKH